MTDTTPTAEEELADALRASRNAHGIAVTTGVLRDAVVTARHELHVLGDHAYDTTRPIGPSFDITVRELDGLIERFAAVASNAVRLADQADRRVTDLRAKAAR